MQKEIIKLLKESVSLSHAIEQNVILEQDFNSLAENIVKLFTIPDVIKSVCVHIADYDFEKKDEMFSVCKKCGKVF